MQGSDSEQLDPIQKAERERLAAPRWAEVQRHMAAVARAKKKARLDTLIEETCVRSGFPAPVSECDCGAAKTQDTHARWCSTKEDS